MLDTKIFFLTGHRKSGTTMFQRLFDGHPDLLLYPVDLSVFYGYHPYFTKKYFNQPEKLRKRLKLVLDKSFFYYMKTSEPKKVGKINNFISNLIKYLPDSSLTSKKELIYFIVKYWIKEFGSNKKENILVFKETSQSVFFERMQTIFKNIKFISIIRDPRDNYAAIKAGVENYYSKIGESRLESLASLINRSRLDLISAQLNKDKYPDKFYALRFEDLVEDVESHMIKVCKFLKIDYDEILKYPTVNNIIYRGNNHSGKKFNSVSKVNINKWKDRITSEEAMIIEYWLNDVMRIWNYKLYYKLEESQVSFSEFYNWYNSKYFYRDSFKNLNPE